MLRLNKRMVEILGSIGGSNFGSGMGVVVEREERGFRLGICWILVSWRSGWVVYFGCYLFFLMSGKKGYFLRVSDLC